MGRIRRIALLALIILLPVTPFIVLLGFNAGVRSGEADWLAGLQPLGAAELLRAPVGRRVLLEGRVGAASATTFRSFVAYVRERRYLDADLGETWFEEARVSQPFVLELADGVARIANAHYAIVNPTASWTAPGTPITNPTRYTGFAVGDRVFVVGTVARSAGDAVLQAEVVIGGTREAYVAAQGATTSSATLLSLFFVAAVLIVSGAVYAARRQARFGP